MDFKNKLRKLFAGSEPLSDPVEDIMPARCTKTREDFFILLGNVNGKTTMLSGSLNTGQKDSCFSSGGNSTCTLELANGIVAGRRYKCPVCGNRSIVRCGKCHHITCADGSGQFRCAYCYNSGTVSGHIKKIDVISSKGLKSDGPQYPPGDKGDKP